MHALYLPVHISNQLIRVSKLIRSPVRLDAASIRHLWLTLFMLGPMGNSPPVVRDERARRCEPWVSRSLGWPLGPWHACAPTVVVVHSLKELDT